MVAGGVRQDVRHSDALARKKAATQTGIFNVRPRLTSEQHVQRRHVAWFLKRNASRGTPPPRTVRGRGSYLITYDVAFCKKPDELHAVPRFPHSRQRAGATLTPACRAGLGASHGREMLYDDKPVDLALQEGVQERRVVTERHAAI